jgi:GTPase SAR1 family protein
MYYKDANVALLVYDKSSKESLDNLKMWKTQLEEKGPRNVMKVILGNKYDLPNDESSVATSEGEAFARECNAMFFKTSAKEGTGVVEAFEAICEKLYNSDGMSPTKESKGTKLGGKQGGNTGKKCC